MSATVAATSSVLPPALATMYAHEPSATTHTTPSEQPIPVSENEFWVRVKEVRVRVRVRVRA